MTDRPSLTLGIEEEYLIVDQETGELVQKPDEAFFDACREALGDQVTVERYAVAVNWLLSATS